MRGSSKLIKMSALKLAMSTVVVTSKQHPVMTG
jgi:hypothetical protein